MSADPLAWAQMMRLGLGVLRYAPEAFWALTPAELVRALEGAGAIRSAAAPMGRARLETLMRDHPDATRREERNGT